MEKCEADLELEQPANPCWEDYWVFHCELAKEHKGSHRESGCVKGHSWTMEWGDEDNVEKSEYKEMVGAVSEL